MVVALILAFIVVPIVELAVILQISQVIGLLPTLALVVVVSVTGAWLVKREGVGVLRRMQEQLQQGQLPAKEIVNGVLILFAGALMLTPGFVTDLLGLVLLVPPTRALVRAVLMRRFEHRIRDAFAVPTMGGDPFGGPFGDPFGGPGASVGPPSVGGRVYSGTATYDVVDVEEAGGRSRTDRSGLAGDR